MTATVVLPQADDRAEGARHFQRTTLFLVLNTATTGVFGALFWLVAARVYSEEEVGVAVAAASLLLALAFAAQINASSALSRFLPAAGSAQKSTVLLGYRAALGGAVVIGALVLGIGAARGGAIVEGGDWTMTLVLALSLPLWVVFALQDNVLAAVRRSPWIPIENGLATFAKFGLLPLCIGLAHGSGILLAWVLPAIVAVPVVNWALFRHYLEPGSARVPDPRAFFAFAVRDLPAQVSILFAMRLVPLIVVERRGTLEGALIGLPWSILTVAALALPTLALSLMAELSREGADANALERRSALLVVALLLPLTMVGALLAGPVLSVAGGEYADRGAGVLAWGLLGLAPAALIESGLASLRVRGRAGLVTTVQVVRSLLLLGGVFVLIGTAHVTDIGKAFLAVNVLGALVVWTLVQRSEPPLSLAKHVAAPPPREIHRQRYRGSPRPAGMALRITVLLLGGTLALAAAFGARPEDISGLGILPALPLAYFVGLALIIVNFVIATPLTGRRASAWTFVNVVALAFLLHGLPGLIEPNPRFSVAWLHAGFIDHVAERGTLLTLDGRFSWAGFFSGSALIQRAGDTESTLWMVRFAPVAVNLFICWGISLLAGILGAPRRRRMLAMVLFLLVNWTGQDYFSPQATAFCLALVILVVVLVLFAGDASKPPLGLARLLRSAPSPATVPGARLRLLGYTGVLVVLASIAASHQLTPMYLTIVLALLALTGAMRLRWLWLSAAVITTTWIAYGATTYWRGHLAKITGSIGEVSTLVDDNVSSRTSGGDFDRRIAVFSRMGLTGLVALGAGIVLLVAYRRRRTPTVLLCMLVAPVPLFLAQTYGGEMLIRVYLFALPAAVILVATGMSALARTTRRQAGVGVLLALLVPVFVLARFGNEEYEQVTRNDHEVLVAVYESAPSGSVVYVANRQTVLFSQRVEEVRFRQLRELEPGPVIGQIRQDDASGGAFVLLTESQAAFGRDVQHKPADWMEVVADDLLATGSFVVVTSAGDSLLLQYDRGGGSS